MKKRRMSLSAVILALVLLAGCSAVRNTADSGSSGTEAVSSGSGNKTTVSEKETETEEENEEERDAEEVPTDDGTAAGTEAESESSGRTTEESGGRSDPTDGSESNSGTFADFSSGSFRITSSNGTVRQDGTVFTIASAGEYTLTGTLSEGRIVVDAGESAEVVLKLNGVSITCSSNAPIWVKTADKVKLSAEAGTVNTVTDKRALQTADDETQGSAAVYAESDLALTGTGSLTVTASYNNGVQTKDDLKVETLTLSVTAPNNALKGNDSLTVASGSITAKATAGDALKSDNSDVSSKGKQRGIVTVSGGTLELTAADDGIDAAYDVEISGGSVTVNASDKGIVANNSVTVSGGTVNVTAGDDAIHANNDNALESGAAPLGNVTVSGGSVTVSTGDDGLHADGTLLIKDGTVNVLTSREGLEGHYVTVDGGEIRVYATDDGVNASSSSSRTSDGLITVNGGTMYVEVAGRDTDGIDANGSYRQTGGFVVVSNPNSDAGGNMAAVDADGSVSVTGGVIVALGTVPGGGMGGMTGGMGGGMGGPGGMGGMNGRGGRTGMGGMTSGSSLPSGYVTYSGTLSAGTHTFSYGGNTWTFTLKSGVSGGWIWAEGITDGNYTLR